MSLNQKTRARTEEKEKEGVTAAQQPMSPRSGYGRSANGEQRAKATAITDPSDSVGNGAVNLDSAPVRTRPVTPQKMEGSK